MIAATVGTWVTWPTTYQSGAELTLVGSKSLAAEPGGGNNPYAVVGDLVPLANILAADLASNQALVQLKNRGVIYPYTATVPPGGIGPFVSISLSGKNQSVIRRSMPRIIEFAEYELRRLQTDVSRNLARKSVIGAAVIADPSPPKPVLKTKIEITAGVAIAAAVLTLLLSFAAEARTRRQRKDRRAIQVEGTRHGHRQAARTTFAEEAWEATRTR